jgi:hypothetical protein
VFCVWHLSGNILNRWNRLNPRATCHELTYLHQEDVRTHMCHYFCLMASNYGALKWARLQLVFSRGATSSRRHKMYTARRVRPSLLFGLKGATP